MHKAERNKLGKSTSLSLNVAKQQELTHPVLSVLDMTIHHRRGRADAERVSRRNHFDPLLDRQLLTRDLRAHSVIQYLRCGAGQCTESRFFEHHQVFGQ